MLNRLNLGSADSRWRSSRNRCHNMPLNLFKRHDELRRRQHRRLPAVLPAATRPAHAPLARRPLLRSRAAHRDHLRGFGRPLAARPVRPVTRLSRRRQRSASFINNPRPARRRLHRVRRQRRDIRAAPFDNKQRRRRRATAATPQREAEAEQRHAQHERRDDSSLTETSPAPGAEPPARPRSPASAHDSLAALRTEVRPVHHSPLLRLLSFANARGAAHSGRATLKI